MVVKYFPRSNISQLFWQFFQYGSWKRKVIFKHPKSMKIRQLAPPSLVAMIVASLILFVLFSAWYLIPLTTYLLVSIAVAILQRKLPLQLRVTLSLIFITMHVAWGLGFLVGRATTLTIPDKWLELNISLQVSLTSYAELPRSRHHRKHPNYNWAIDKPQTHLLLLDRQALVSGAGRQESLSSTIWTRSRFSHVISRLSLIHIWRCRRRG